MVAQKRENRKSVLIFVIRRELRNLEGIHGLIQRDAYTMCMIESTIMCMWQCEQGRESYKLQVRF